ncbi:hypothetical protein BELL_0197g00050 [Botrytis elliptica]|uniref:Uncharacterized protein n=1 Tax=Botrytis elliptica TaxID=278938 RepID=A0A4Z1JQ45_9HELO|nr:hypothetical protein EAE99_007962 [Botrytis elliptica]TGO75698.1 hypothetical protein BELL_0197g00050 [Botrytis elliptica]
MAKLDDLPQELKDLILCAAPDIATLKCLAHSSPFFHGAYANRREDIFLTVLSTEITPDILHEARFVARATSIERGSSWFSNVKQLLADYDKGIDELFPLNITSTETIYISRFLPALHNVTLAFFQMTLSHHPLTGEKMHPPSPDRFEIRRIQRSILRIEIFNILFSERKYSPSYRPNWESPCEELGNLFLSRFELWEVEEMVCTRDFFYRQYDVVFRGCSVELRNWFALNEYCEEDPGDSIENAVARTKEKDFIDYREMSERLLSLGFEFLWEVLNDYSKYQEFPLLEEAFFYGEFQTPPNFLSDTLAIFFSLRDMQIMQDSEFRKTVLDSEYTGKEKPNLAWLWSVQQWNPAFDGGNYVSYCERRDCLRSWGYAMWDSSRLESLGIMNCKIQDMQPHGPKAMQGPLLTDDPQENES